MQNLYQQINWNQIIVRDYFNLYYFQKTAKRKITTNIYVCMCGLLMDVDINSSKIEFIESIKPSWI